MGDHPVNYGSGIIDGRRIEAFADHFPGGGVSVYNYYVFGVRGVYKGFEEGIGLWGFGQGSWSFQSFGNAI